MNFFAHAVVAHRERDEPRFLLGAMLPDLTSMASLRVQSIHHPDLAAGVALHHETDRKFHGLPVFRSLCESALNELEAAGVSRGAARAVGHVGSELLLDGVLSHAEAARAAYSRALEVGLAHALHELEFADAPALERLRELLQWLSTGPLPEGYRDVDFVGDRLQRILARRPRLALRDRDRMPVRAWLERASTIVEREAVTLAAP